MNALNPSGICVTIMAENFEEVVLNSPLPILLDFWASWCVPCKLMKSGVEKAAQLLESEATVGLVNVDEQPDIVERFGVRGTPTFVLLRNGEVLATFSGITTAGGLASRVRAAIQG